MGERKPATENNTQKAEKKQIATRDAYGEALLELGREREDIVVLDADLSGSTKTGKFAKAFPGRFYNIGVSEQDLIGTVLDGTLSAFQNMTDGSFSLSLKGSFDLPKAVPFSVSLTYTGGEAGDEFTYFSGQNGLSASVQVRFEF